MPDQGQAQGQPLHQASCHWQGSMIGASRLVQAACIEARVFM